MLDELRIDVLDLALAEEVARQHSLAFEVVGELVGMEVGLLVESLWAVAVGTDEWFLTCMNAHMRLEVEIEGEAFVAEAALVGLFTCMDKHVSF